MQYARIMRIDISLLPALAAAFMLVFARIGAMVMLLPGLGESNIPVRVKLGIALLLTLVILPLHRAAYHIDMQSLTPLMVLMVHEIVIGVVLGATARVTLSALQVAGSVIAQQLGLGFVTAIDPTQGQQGLLIGNFLTILGLTLLFATDSHHLVIAALNDSYSIFSPGELMPSGDVAALATRAFAAVSGFWSGFQYRAWRAGAADAANASLFRRRAAIDSCRIPHFRPRYRGDDGDLSRLFCWRHARPDPAQLKAWNHGRRRRIR
jgi:flagellar biosynthesis protein FliR